MYFRTAVNRIRMLSSINIALNFIHILHFRIYLILPSTFIYDSISVSLFVPPYEVCVGIARVSACDSSLVHLPNFVS